MRVLGIDPGTATIGWGVVDQNGQTQTAIDYGHISTHKDTPFAERLVEIADDIEALLRKYQPDEVAIEELFFYNNQKTAISVAQARGVILLTCERFSGSVYGYTPLEIKQALTNYGRADKTQVQQMVKHLLKLTEIPRPDDTADALAIALCHLSRRKLEIINSL